MCVCVHGRMLTFQSSEVTSLLLGTSCPPSRMQCLRTSCVELLVLFSLRFQIRAVESPDLWGADVVNLCTYAAVEANGCDSP